MELANSKIAFVGAGNMASALIGGLIPKGCTTLWACDPSEAALQNLQKTAISATLHTSTNSDELAQAADVILLAVKPQVMDKACASLKTALQGRKPLIISIAAGIPLASLEAYLGNDLPIVRCMPNTPALVGLGATGLYANTHVSANQKQQAEQILSAVGFALWLEQEQQLDAVTAVSGSGPAYFFLLIEAMVEAGQKLGLSETVARQLTLQTALGAATMAGQSDDSPAELRRKVTSPGGTTEQAIQTFQAGGFEALVEKALQAAADRSVSLSQELSAKS